MALTTYIVHTYLLNITSYNPDLWKENKSLSVYCKDVSWNYIAFGSFHFRNFVFSYFGHFSCAIFFKFVSVLPILPCSVKKSKQTWLRIFVTSSTKTKNGKWNEKLNSFSWGSQTQKSKVFSLLSFRCIIVPSKNL